MQFVGHQGGYGNLIVVRHKNGYSTAYGHLSGFAKGLRAGQHVSQGDVIGYVGMTGLGDGSASALRVPSERRASEPTEARRAAGTADYRELRPHSRRACGRCSSSSS